jgi:hypothetical protein
LHTYNYTVNNFIGCDTTTVKKIGLVGLYSGRQIKAKAAKGESITRSQSAKGALAAIKKKYGEVPDSAKFVHKGKGLWVRYSLANDKKRTGNVTVIKKRNRCLKLLHLIISYCFIRLRTSTKETCFSF